MIFQALDNKLDCVGIYADGKLYKHTNSSELDLQASWDATPNLMIEDALYAKLLCEKDEIGEACPEHLKEEWGVACKKLKVFLRCFGTAQINLNENCFFDLVPDSFLMNLYETKNKITRHILENSTKPKNYEFMKEVNFLLHEIGSRTLNLNLQNANRLIKSQIDASQFNKIKNASNKIGYNMYAARTGRLATKPNSFPILNFNKKFREVLRPNNDWLLELDFNANELRVLLALAGKEQPPEDIHEWNAKNVYRGLVSREEAKERIFAWLYNPESKDLLSNRAYDRSSIKEKYWDGKIITTPFERRIESDEFHALNYLIQSTASDLLLKQALKIRKLLNGRTTFIAAVIHDSVLIDYKEEDHGILKELVKTFKETELGVFKANISVGRNFGAMREL